MSAIGRRIFERLAKILRFAAIPTASRAQPRRARRAEVGDRSGITHKYIFLHWDDRCSSYCVSFSPW
jgi:hypothetical protein